MLKSSFYCFLLFSALGYGPIADTSPRESSQITEAKKTPSPAISPANSTEPPWPADSIQSFKIQIPNLRLTFEQSPRSSYKISAENLSLTNIEGELVIQSQDFSDPKLFLSALSKKPVPLKISGPSRPLSVFATHSQIQAKGWKSSVLVSSLSGQVTSLNTGGDWNIALKSGSVTMKKHKGDIQLKSFNARVSITESQGSFNLQLNEGHLKLRQSQAVAKVTGDRASIQLKQFQGDLTAFSRSGDISGSLKPGELKIQTETGNVRLYVIKQGPYVKAYTERGKIYVPRYFNKQFEGKSTRVSGRLVSKIKKGKIFVESERGNIYIQ